MKHPVKRELVAEKEKRRGAWESGLPQDAWRKKNLLTKEGVMRGLHPMRGCGWENTGGTNRRRACAQRGLEKTRPHGKDAFKKSTAQKGEGGNRLAAFQEKEYKKTHGGSKGSEMQRRHATGEGRKRGAGFNK